MGERGARHTLDVVRRGVGPARNESARLHRAEEALRAARRDAEEQVLAVPRAPDDREHVIHELAGHGDALGRGLRGSQLLERERRRERRQDTVGAAREEKAPLVLRRGIAERDAHEEAVELRLGERVRAEILHRVLRREDEERLGQRPGDAVGGDGPLAHRLQERRLRLRRRAVDLVGQEHRREHGARVKLELLRPHVEDREAEDVGRQRVRRELYAMDADAERLAERRGERRLADARDVFDQEMAPREKTHDRVLHGRHRPAVGRAHGGDEPPERREDGRRGRVRRGGRSCVRHRERPSSTLLERASDAPRRMTRMPSGESTTATSDSPTTRTGRPSARMRLPEPSTAVAGPSSTFLPGTPPRNSKTASHEPRALQPHAQGTVSTCRAFSITPTSKEMEGADEKISVKEEESPALRAACARRAIFRISGQALSISSKRYEIRNTKMPAFQKKRPEARNSSTRAIVGFSTKRTTPRAASAAARRAARNAVSSRTAWSDGSTARTVSGASSEAASAERAMAGAVLRRTGSRTKRDRGTSGSSAVSSGACAARPETKTFSAPARAVARRSVSLRSDSPPVSFRKGFGRSFVERGHSRVPLPPARMSARTGASVIGTLYGSGGIFRHDPDLRLELDSEPVLDGPLHLLHQPLHVRRRRTAEVDDDVRVNGRDLRASDAPSLHTALLQQLAREEAGRILEDGPRVRLFRKRSFPLRGHLLDARGDLLHRLREEAQRDAGDDVVRSRERCPAVTVRNFRGGHRPALAPSRDEVDRYEGLEDLGTVGPRVDPHGCAERRRNARKVLEPGQAGLLRRNGERHERHAAARDHVRRLDPRRQEVPREREDDSGETRIRHEEVRAFPEREDRKPIRPARDEERGERVHIVDLHEKPRRPADPERRPPGKRNVLAHDRA